MDKENIVIWVLSLSFYAICVLLFYFVVPLLLPDDMFTPGFFVLITVILILVLSFYLSNKLAEFIYRKL